MVKLWGELNMSQKDVKKLYPKLYGKIRQDMVNQIYNKGAETKGVKGAESIPPKLLTGMYDEIYKNMAKTGDIKKKYGGSMKKMNEGKKVGSTSKDTNDRKLTQKDKDTYSATVAFLRNLGRQDKHNDKGLLDYFKKNMNYGIKEGIAVIAGEPLAKKKYGAGSSYNQFTPGYSPTRDMKLFKDSPPRGVGTKKKKSGGPIKKLRVGGKVGMTQHQMMAQGRKK